MQPAPVLTRAGSPPVCDCPAASVVKQRCFETTFVLQWIIIGLTTPWGVMKSIH